MMIVVLVTLLPRFIFVSSFFVWQTQNEKLFDSQLVIWSLCWFHLLVVRVSHSAIMTFAWYPPGREMILTHQLMNCSELLDTVEMGPPNYITRSRKKLLDSTTEFAATKTRHQFVARGWSVLPPVWCKRDLVFIFVVTRKNGFVRIQEKPQ